MYKILKKELSPVSLDSLLLSKWMKKEREFL